MKIETTKQFKPFEVIITIDSKEELNALLDMCMYNQSIPDLVDEVNSNFIKLFLNETRDALNKHV